VAGAIASMHCIARTAADTDWRTIAALYDCLFEMTPSAVVALNRAVAVGFATEPRDGLAALDATVGEGLLDDYYPYHVARAELSLRAGDRATARSSFARALHLTRNEAERAFLGKRLADAGGPSPG